MGHRASYRLMPSSHALLIMLLTGATSLAWSQTTGEDAGQSLALAQEALAQLDELAGNCLEEQAGTESCTGFRQALDGELLVTYINSCATARRWRDEFVTMQVESANDQAATRNTEAENLQLMIDVARAMAILGTLLLAWVSKLDVEGTVLALAIVSLLGYLSFCLIHH